jgi:hypothetical protein
LQSAVEPRLSARPALSFGRRSPTVLGQEVKPTHGPRLAGLFKVGDVDPRGILTPGGPRTRPDAADAGPRAVPPLRLGI